MDYNQGKSKYNGGIWAAKLAGMSACVSISLPRDELSKTWSSSLFQVDQLKDACLIIIIIWRINFIGRVFVFWIRRGSQEIDKQDLHKIRNVAREIFKEQIIINYLFKWLVYPIFNFEILSIIYWPNFIYLLNTRN